MYYRLKLRSPFTPFFALVFKPPFQCEASLKKLRTGTQNSNTSSTSATKIIIERQPQPRAAKRLRLGRGQTSEINNLYNTSSCFPKGPEVSKGSQKGSRNPSFGHPKPTKIGKKSTLTNSREQNHENWSESRFSCQKTLLSRGFLVPFLSLGPSWNQTGPQVSPKSPLDGPKPHCLLIVIEIVD